jgi:hypothetical protein
VLAEGSEALAALTSAGGVLIIGISLKLLGLKDVRVGNFLPALVIAPGLVGLVAAIGGVRRRRRGVSERASKGEERPNVPLVSHSSTRGTGAGMDRSNVPAVRPPRRRGTLSRRHGGSDPRPLPPSPR